MPGDDHPRVRAVLIGLASAMGLVALGSGTATAYERPWLGTYVADATAPWIGPESGRWTGAARVAKIEGPAASAGMQPFDVIVEVDGEPIAGSKDLTCRIAARTPGAKVRLTVVRAQRRLLLTATLGRWPEREQADQPPPGCAPDLISGTSPRQPA